MKNNLSHIDIKNFLPHRGQMLMVDTLLSIDEKSVKSNFSVQPSCIFVHDNKMRESGLLENMAQTCSSIVGQSFFEEDDLTGEHNQLIGFISAIKSVSIVQLPNIHETIETHAQLVSRFDGEGYSLCTMQCAVYVNDLTLASCEMNLFIQEV
ncbi:ABC transporter permease [Flavobacteriaceae bacterium F08102]|nr:ABC transporter permease [Flavobacteriaceae bacterium F08102]